jgi:hypothetical protein
MVGAWCRELTNSSVSSARSWCALSCGSNVGEPSTSTRGSVTRAVCVRGESSRTSINFEQAIAHHSPHLRLPRSGDAEAVR